MEPAWIQGSWVVDERQAAYLLGIEPRSLHKHRDSGDLAEIRRFRWHNVPLYDYVDVMAVAGRRLDRRNPTVRRRRGRQHQFEATEITVTINHD